MQLTTGWDTFAEALKSYDWQEIVPTMRGDRPDIIAYAVIDSKRYFLLHNRAMNPPYYIGEVGA
jgi:hypothetical protein